MATSSALISAARDALDHHYGGCIEDGHIGEGCLVRSTLEAALKKAEAEPRVERKFLSHPDEYNVTIDRDEWRGWDIYAERPLPPPPPSIEERLERAATAMEDCEHDCPHQAAFFREAAATIRELRGKK